MHKYKGRDSLIVKGSCLLSSVYAPYLASISFQNTPILTVPVLNLPMHPSLWGCNRLLNVFTSYIRWNLKSLKVRFVPFLGTNQPGTLMMAFTSCIQDGGPDGSGDQLQGAMMDIPGSLSISLGFPDSRLSCKMPFIDAFDWGFTCRTGNDINEIYQGALVVALTGTPQLFRDASGSSVYLGQLILDYEIALAEPASTLSLLRPPIKGTWKPTIPVGQPAAIAWDQSSVRNGDILSLPWYLPSESGSDNTNLQFLDPTGVVSGASPKNGETVYVRVWDSPTSSANYPSTIHKSLATAMRATSVNDNSLRSVAPSSLDTTSWINTAFNVAKVILPAAIDAATTILL